jgi:hypothetical protein
VLRDHRYAHGGPLPNCLTRVAACPTPEAVNMTLVTDGETGVSRRDQR